MTTPQKTAAGARPAMDRWLVRLFLAAACALVAFNYSGVLQQIVKEPPGDFMVYYFAGKLAASGQISQINHKPAYAPLAAELGPRYVRPSALHTYYFQRPAFAAFFYVPYSWLSYRKASLAAMVVNLLLLGIFIWKAPLWFPFPDFFGVGLLRVLLCLFMGFRAAVGNEQDIVLLALLLAFGLHLAMEDREIAGGIVLAFCLFKPHLVWAAPLALLAGGKRKTFYSFLAAGLVLAAFSFSLIGPQGAREWIVLLQAPSSNYRPEDMASLRAVAAWFGWVTAAACALPALAGFGLVLRRGSLADRISAALIVGLLLSPHAYRYDLSLLAIVALLADRPAARYIFLVPWLNFYPHLELLPIIFGLLGYLAYLAAKPMVAARWPLGSLAEAAQDPGSPAELGLAPGEER